jgi:hypothetical protein
VPRPPGGHASVPGAVRGASSSRGP